MTDLFDRLRTALADRYRTERELGVGGVATVSFPEPGTRPEGRAQGDPTGTREWRRVR